jgi:penicillin-binding protein 1A
VQSSARYFTDWALPQLDTMIDETAEPIDVWTTLDPKMQKAAEMAIRAHTPRGAQGALVALDRDGAVRAMVGGTDYVSSIYNRATQAVRQPGSAFKLFVYMAALEAGMTPQTTMVDEAIDINGWRPRNSSGRFAGEMTLRTAFTYSVNTIAAKIGQEVGTSAVAGMARRFGISTPINTLPSMVLGTSDARLIDMTRAYAAVSAKGASVTPYAITRVTTAKGRMLYTIPKRSSQQLVEPWVAAGITDLLQTAVNAGTGRAAQIGRPVAGKTGTTSSNKDGWFLGFSSGITAGVWMGRDDARRVGDLQGGTAPARAFSSFMRTAVAGRAVEQFETEVTLPEWQLETDEEAYFGDPDNGQFVDENGQPIDPGSADPGGVDPSTLNQTDTFDQGWVDEMVRRTERPADPQASRPNQ